MSEQGKGIIDLILSLENQETKNELQNVLKTAGSPDEIHAWIQNNGFSNVTTDESNQIFAQKDILAEDSVTVKY